MLTLEVSLETYVNTRRGKFLCSAAHTDVDTSSDPKLWDRAGQDFSEAEAVDCPNGAHCDD